MKTIVVVMAGAADRPLEDLGGRTPLEAAQTPVLDTMAGDGRLGRLATAPEALRAEEGAFALSMFGLDPLTYGEVGGALDAAAYGVKVGSLDQVFRLALVTADASTVFDPVAGHISRDEADLLLAALAEVFADPDVSFHAGNGWRNVLLWRGARDVRVKTVPPFDVVGKSLQAAMPKGTGIGRLLAAIERSADVMTGHEVNDCRRDLGENPATLVWPWGPGVSLPLPAFKARTGVDAALVGVHPGFVGAAKLQEIDVLESEGATGRVDTHLRAKAERALSALEDHDLVFLHVDALAGVSHARDFVAKVETLERIDGALLGPLLEAVKGRSDLRLVTIVGEAVSVETGRHLPDPVPFVIVGPGVRGQRHKNLATEVGARDAGFFVDEGHELLDFLLHLPA